MKKEEHFDTGQVIIIFNSIPPYAYEVNNLLALPNGFTYRFRFRKKWMADDVETVDLKGRRGLAVLRDFDTARFIPLRRIRIANVVEFGEVSYIEYNLEDIIDFDSVEEIRNKQLDDFNERMKPSLGHVKNEPGTNLEKLIFKYSDVAYGIRDEHFAGDRQNRDSNSWGNLIRILGGMKCYIDFDFLKVTQIADSEGKAAPVVSHPHPNTARFHLKSDQVYRVQIFQTTFTGLVSDSSVITPRRMVISGEPGEVRVIRSTYSIAGKYDLLQFSFKTESAARTKETSLSLEIHRDDETALWNIDIPIRVSASKAQKLIWGASLICFAVGTVLLFGADQFKSLSPSQANLLERVGILVAIVSSYGIGPVAKSVLDRLGIEYQI